MPAMLTNLIATAGTQLGTIHPIQLQWIKNSVMTDPVIETLDTIPKLPLDERERAINRLAFIRLWTLASAVPEYVKADWMRLDRLLDLNELI